MVQYQIFFISNQKDVRGYQKVAPGKIYHKNAIKSCQNVLFSSKSATERPSSCTVVCLGLPNLPSIPRKRMDEKCRFSKLDASYLTIIQAKRSGKYFNIPG